MNAPPKILLLTHRVPYPPDRGDRIRSHHLLRYLAGRSRVSLATVSQAATPTGHRVALEQLCERVAIEPTTAAARAARDAWSLARGRSATEGHFWSPRLAETIAEWASREPFGAVVCFCSGMYRYTRLKPLQGLPTFVDLVDVDSQKWQDCASSSRWPLSWVHRLEAIRVRTLEEEICDRAEKVLIISHEEREVLMRHAPCSNAVVAGNGVDTGYFDPGSEPKTDAATPTCCFIGVLNYLPNVDGLSWFVEEVWPQVTRRLPDARFRIVGRSPSKTVIALAETQGVELHADVPDVRPFMAEAVVVAPLRIARGVQNKVLEAMAMARPVVASPAALTGVAADPEHDLVVADRAEEWAKHLLDLFDNEPERRRLGAAARRFVLGNHSWDEKLAPFGEALGLSAPSPVLSEAAPA